MTSGAVLALLARFVRDLLFVEPGEIRRRLDSGAVKAGES